jgi:hypothetical protein
MLTGNTASSRKKHWHKKHVIFFICIDGIRLQAACIQINPIALSLSCILSRLLYLRHSLNVILVTAFTSQGPSPLSPFSNSSSDA